MTKRNNGEGSISQRGNTWRGQFRIGTERISVTGNTGAEVVEKMAEARTDYRRGVLLVKSDTTVREWIPIWMERRVRPNLTDQSYMRYEKMFENHIFPALGDYKLQELTKPLLEQKYAEIFQKKGENCKHNERDYSHSTVNSISVQMKKCLAYAVECEILAKNPHEHVHLHKLRPPKKVEAYTLEEHQGILDFCYPAKQIYWTFFLLGTTGMRIGESFALTWDDYNKKNKTLTINKTSVEMHGSPIIQMHTKTDAGTRTISLSKDTINFLDEIRKEVDNDLNYRNLIIPNTRYGIRTSANTSRLFQRVCATLDIEYRGVHVLRHSWATRALEAGVDIKTVSAMLGHKNVITTMNIYQDVLTKHQEKAVKQIDKLFKK